jgi:hypothetical protein
MISGHLLYGLNNAINDVAELNNDALNKEHKE